MQTGGGAGKFFFSAWSGLVSNNEAAQRLQITLGSQNAKPREGGGSSVETSTKKSNIALLTQTNFSRIYVKLDNISSLLPQTACLGKICGPRYLGPKLTKSAIFSIFSIFQISEGLSLIFVARDSLEFLQIPIRRKIYNFSHSKEKEETPSAIAEGMGIFT